MTKHLIVAVTVALAAVFVTWNRSPQACADIFQWEYINPTVPSLGKQQSTTLAPDGAGAVAEPGSNLSNHNLTKAYLIGADLSPYLEYDYYYINGYARSNLTSANLSQADLSFASFNAAILTDTNLTGADVRGANFDRYDQYGYSHAYGYGTGITMGQLTSTASYLAHDLAGISLGMHNLTGANFSEFNLIDARFAGADLTNVNFSNANLTRATVGGTLTGTNFTNAVVRSASLWGVTKAQLYSTASYQSGDLTGIYFYSSQTNWNFAGKNLSGAQFQSSMNFSNSNFTGANLSSVYLSYINFQNANLSQANLTNANFSLCKLTGANLTGADVRGANFTRDVGTPASGLTATQLASTASYLADDLSGMRLRYNLLAGISFAGKTLTNVDLVGASLEGADLTGADVRGARLERDISRNVGGITVAQLQSTASYQTQDLSGIGLGGNNLAGANLSGQNLTNASFEGEGGYGANLSGANLNDANLTNVPFGYSTLTGATFVRANLTNAALGFATLTNANFAEANLSGGGFGGYVIVVPGDSEGGGGYYNAYGTEMSGVNLSGANITNANFMGTEDFFGYPFPGANLTNANLSGADARGANFQYASMSGAITANLIQSNGHIAGLDLAAGKSLNVRDYKSYQAAELPIVVDQGLSMDGSGALRIAFDADPWGSTISFAPGIPVTLGGTLELTFAPEVNLPTQIGRTIDLFNWTGVTPTGVFTVSSPYAWNLSKLYTTGEVTLTAVPGLLPGDFDGDGDVDGRDFLAWQRNPSLGNLADWQANYGMIPLLGANSTAVPEPAAGMMLLLLGMMMLDPRSAPTRGSIFDIGGRRGTANLAC